MDVIRLREAQPDCPTGVTVLGGSMFFKDTDRVLKTMRRRGTASAFGDMFGRRYNPIHGADLAARCCAFCLCCHAQTQRCVLVTNRRWSPGSCVS